MKSWVLENLKKKSKEEVSGFLTVYFLIRSCNILLCIFSYFLVVEKPDKTHCRHFGLPLKTSLQNAKDDGLNHLTDSILEQLLLRGFFFISTLFICLGTAAEGLIRIPGNKEVIFHAKKEIDDGHEPDWASFDVYDLAGLLKVTVIIKLK